MGTTQTPGDQLGSVPPAAQSRLSKFLRKNPAGMLTSLRWNLHNYARVALDKLRYELITWAPRGSSPAFHAYYPDGLRSFPDLTDLYHRWIHGNKTNNNGDAATSHYARTAWLLLLFAAVLILLWLNPRDLLLPLRTEALQFCYALVVYLLALTPSRLLTNHAMQMAGEISYSIYILQFPVLFAYDDAMHRLFPQLGHISILYISVLCLVSYWSFRFVETPARILIRRVFTKRPVPLRPV